MKQDEKGTWEKGLALVEAMANQGAVLWKAGGQDVIKAYKE